MDVVGQFELVYWQDCRDAAHSFSASIRVSPQQAAASPRTQRRKDSVGMRTSSLASKARAE